LHFVPELRPGWLYRLPNDVTAPSSPSLLLRANLLIFDAKLDDATKLVRGGASWPAKAEEWQRKTSAPFSVRVDERPRGHVSALVADEAQKETDQMKLTTLVRAAVASAISEMLNGREVA
jgi:hypothetical protein